MKVIIQNQIIDLSLVYRIGEIRGNAEGWLINQEKADEEFMITHNIYWFEICFYNRNGYHVKAEFNRPEIEGSKVSPEEFKEYLEEREKTKRRLEGMRDNLMQYWAKCDKKDIPIIGSEEDHQLPLSEINYWEAKHIAEILCPTLRELKKIERLKNCYTELTFSNGRILFYDDLSSFTVYLGDSPVWVSPAMVIKVVDYLRAQSYKL